MPIPNLHPAPPAAPRAGEATAVHGTVLYIEDNAANRHLMQRILGRRPNLQYLSALDGETGIALARQRRPDVILLDVHLPGMTGEEVLDRLRQDPSTRDIATVVLTADVTPGLQRRLMAAGAREYLTKPLHVAHVLQIIDHYAPGKTVA